ncbi:uncharacterized protein [Phaseolus vulgaris]|uniref:uncharacterized protein n=1 Tax=Phaseolus vulgaris TaxID=3885 RepID=UPI0035CC363A
MRVLFDYHELWDVVESGVFALGDNATEAQRVAHRDQKKDNKVLYLIHQRMKDETFEQIEGATTASEAWIILSTNYKGDEKIKRMETTETIDVYINKVIPKFEHVVAVIEEAKDISKMTVRLLSGSLRVHEHQMNDNKIEKPIEQALQAQVSIDSSYNEHGCTYHMCGKKELFADLDDSFRTKVKFGDGRYIYDVFYVSDMKSNLLSMEQLAEKGYVMHIVENKLSIFDKKRKTWIYVLKSKDEVFHCFKIFKAFVERESGRQIQMVRSDGGARSKLDDKALKTIFIGYKNGGYKLYNPMTKKVIISRDVTFAEDEE